MADDDLPKIQILDLNEDPAPTREAYLPEQKSDGSVWRVAIDAILKLVSATDLKGPLQGADPKVAPEDADNFNLLDNATSWALKTVTWLAIRLGVFLQPSVSLPRAATTNIGAAGSFFISLTGTAAITGLGVSAEGTLRLVQFAGAGTFTNNANTILPTGANITTAAGDLALLRSEGGGVWRCLWYRGSLVTSDWTAGTKTTPGMPTPAQIAAAIASAAAALSGDVKAWVNFNGTGTVAIRASKNVSSITDNGVGDYTVNMITALADANYSVVGNGTLSGSRACLVSPHVTAAGTLSPPTTSAFRVSVSNGGGTAAADPDYCQLSVMR